MLNLRLVHLCLGFGKKLGYMKEKKDHSTLKGSGLVNKLPAVLLHRTMRESLSIRLLGMRKETQKIQVESHAAFYMWRNVLK